MLFECLYSVLFVVFFRFTLKDDLIIEKESERKRERERERERDSEGGGGREGGRQRERA